MGFYQNLLAGKDILENGRFVESKQSQDSTIGLEVLERSLFKKRGRYFPPPLAPKYGTLYETNTCPKDLLWRMMAALRCDVDSVS